MKSWNYISQRPKNSMQIMNQSKEKCKWIMWMFLRYTGSFKNKDWAGKKVTILYSTQQWLKFQKLFNLLTCILLDYVAHEITKRILKNINFENMTAVFLLVCQKSSRCEISLICCWNNDSRKKKITLGYVMVSKNDQNII